MRQAVAMPIIRSCSPHIPSLHAYSFTFDIQTKLLDNQTFTFSSSCPTKHLHESVGARHEWTNKLEAELQKGMTHHQQPPRTGSANHSGNNPTSHPLARSKVFNFARKQQNRTEKERPSLYAGIRATVSEGRADARERSSRGGGWGALWRGCFTAIHYVSLDSYTCNRLARA